MPSALTIWNVTLSKLITNLFFIWVIELFRSSIASLTVISLCHWSSILLQTGSQKKKKMITRKCSIANKPPCGKWSKIHVSTSFHNHASGVVKVNQYQTYVKLRGSSHAVLKRTKDLTCAMYASKSKLRAYQMHRNRNWLRTVYDQMVENLNDEKINAIQV